jgi:hypothetical protein
MVIPFPFATCIIRYGQPYKLPPKAEDIAEAERLQREMDALELWAEGITHG